MALASVTVRGTPEEPIFDFDIPQGEQGPPGGIISTLMATGSDFDGFLTPGAFSVTNVADTATATALHMPINESGTLLVTTSQSNTIPIQLYITNTKGMYLRRRFSGAFNTWRHFAFSRVDQTAGRVIYQWDDLNNREQLIYGDTGWRNIATSIAAGLGGTMLLRRSNNVCQMSATITIPDGTPLGTTLATIPSGSGFTLSNFVPAYIYTRPSASATQMGYRINADGTVVLTTSWPAGGASLYINNSWLTTDAWPTSLPGTASGSIPNA